MLTAHVTRDPELIRSARRRVLSLVAAPTRKLLGWRSIREVARALGVEDGYLSRVLSGKRDPRTRFARKLAKELNVPLGELLDVMHSHSPSR